MLVIGCRVIVIISRNLVWMAKKTTTKIKFGNQLREVRRNAGIS